MNNSAIKLKVVFELPVNMAELQTWFNGKMVGNCEASTLSSLVRDLMDPNKGFDAETEFKSAELIVIDSENYKVL